MSPSRSTLDRTYDRVPRFLRGIATRPEIAAALAARGYRPEDHAEGWDLVHRAAGLVPGVPAVPMPNPSAYALTTLDAWDESGLRLVDACLARRHPDQHAFVLGGLKAVAGPGAVIVVRTLLERLDALDTGEDRAATREADHAALATLAARGIDAGERDRLWTLVQQAQTPAPLPPAPLDETALVAALEDLYAWYKEWSEIARIALRKRSHLITLGLVRRARSQRPDATLDDGLDDDADLADA